MANASRGRSGLIWCAVARHKKSRVRLRQCGPLSGFLYFVKVNVALANRGVAQVDLPPEHCEAAERRVLSLNYSGRFEQWPVGPTLFLRANQLIGGLGQRLAAVGGECASPKRLTGESLIPGPEFALACARRG